MIILIPSAALLLLFHFDIDLLWDSSGWKMILDGEEYYLLDIRKSDNTLFLVKGFFRDTTITIYSPDSGRVSTVNAPDNLINQLEVRDVLWVGSYGSPGPVGYDFVTETWSRHPETEAFGEDIRCSITQDGNLLVHGRDFLREYVDQVWSPNFWTLDEELRSVFQDDEGVIWAKTANNNLYAFTQDHHCEYVGQMRINGGPVRINDSEFWLLGMERVYLWDPATPEISPDFVREFSDESYLRFIKIESDIYYIATSRNIWKYQNGVWEKAKIPILIKSIHNVVFDEVLQRIYIATDRGVYYTDLPL